MTERPNLAARIEAVVEEIGAAVFNADLAVVQGIGARPEPRRRS